MAKSSEQKLFGAKNPKMTSPDGSFQAHAWAGLRAPEAWGHMSDDGDHIVWFKDPTARDEFMQIFQGVAVTLHRRGEFVHAGEAATKLLKRAQMTRGRQ